MSLADLRAVALLTQGGRCYYCRRPLIASEATADHRVPRSVGGETGAMNIVAACLACNSTKGEMSEAEFLAMRRPKAGKKHSRNRRVTASALAVQERKAAERKRLGHQ